MKKVLAIWIFTSLISFCLLGIVYFVVQQDIRIGANDPQIQMAEDTALALNRHEYMNFVQHSIDISQSLSPFLMTFDMNGISKSSQAIFHNQTPTVPPGVFKYVLLHGEDRFTWQPGDGVRIAAVVTKYNDGFVLSGRNIREVEKREDNLLHQIMLGWAVVVTIALVSSIILFSRKK